VYQAAWALGTGRGAALEVAAAKSYGNDALRRIFQHAHQVFGAIGFSTEHDLPLFTRRAKAAELGWGSTTFHRERLAAAMGL
jgi:alkylation response protein AidB-like acyl-CoA dehydrogenase